MLSPVSPELYYSEIADSGNTTACRYTQYIKVDGGHSENKSVESSWEKLTQEIGIDTKSFHAWGIQESDGAFMGMNGWSSLEVRLLRSAYTKDSKITEYTQALKSTTERDSVKKALQELTKYGQVITYILELTKPF